MPLTLDRRYYHATGTAAVNVAALHALFDEYRLPGDGADILSIGATMAYFEALGLQLEDPTVLALSKALDSPSMGEFTRKGFVEGWSQLGADTSDKMKEKIKGLRNSMQTDESFFKGVYLWTFGWAKPEGQKSLPLESAVEWWKLLLHNRFAGHLDRWTDFMTSEWCKSVSKDTWNMLYDFSKFAQGDPTLATYDEMASWPSVIDGYVEHYRGEEH
ncbi:hypothetical protein DRE_02281 [Drechslerella stenobrocha 248]|uniref:Defective in cullin neddylation protein n=1 Tax=Drechslerella stenobrocha 248 TaxID=1043628 RepID=W7I7U9_9PEZI|nr:hypothetical protein DRE_02281 [Drechslerella stenobrocha 248]